VVQFESQEAVEFDLGGLLSGGNGARRRMKWMAHAAHLDAPVEVDAVVCECMGSLSPDQWVTDDVLGEWPQGMLEFLLACGLVVAEHGTDNASVRDLQLRSMYWWPAAAILYRSSRWAGVDAAAATQEAGLSTAIGLRNVLGPPPEAVSARYDAGVRQPLRRNEDGDFDAMLKRRTTCRNFNRSIPLPQALLSRMLERVFAAHGQWQADEETVFLKKSSPSGGGLHPTEAYLIVRDVDGLDDGLYHYHPIDHAVVRIAVQHETLDELAKRAVAGQHWFSEAHVLVVMATRFRRCFWKYRHHPKAYRAVTMDAGHLSQTLYLAATDLGLGAFVTCAINEVDIEQAFGLDPLEEGVMAVGGFGWRGGDMCNAEFDPNGRVWPEQMAQ